MVTRIVFGIVSAVVASTLSILVTASDELIRAWTVATGASIFVTALCGYALLEIRVLRTRLDDTEARNLALISALEHDFHDHEHDSPADNHRSAGNSDRPRRRRPPRRVRRSEAASDGTAELLSQQFQMYLRGRESRFDDDPPMTA
jgi:hypothetical protein